MRARLALLGALALVPAALAAGPDPALQPLAFLAGHCWKGAMPDGKATDEHCFAWLYDGRFLRDRHVVRDGEKAIYEGESTYYWNSVAGRIEYVYFTRNGGYSQGHVTPEGGALAFPAAVLVAGGKSTGFRGRWTRAGDDAYDVLREYETDKGWVPVRMRMKKVE